MTLLQNLPIQRKLMLVIMLTSGVTLLVACSGFVAAEWILFRKELVGLLRTRAQIIAANSTASLMFQNHDDANEILSAMSADPQIIAAALYDETGSLFASYPPTAAPNLLPDTPAREGHEFTKSHLVLFHPVMLNDRRVGTLAILSDLSALHHRFRLYTWVAMFVIGVAAIVAFVISAKLQGQISRPILALADAVGKIGDREDYSMRVEQTGSDEIGQLTVAFNRMLAQIQRLNQVLEQRVVERTSQLEAANQELEAFCYSVSHDLRAPLRHIQGYVDLLEKRIAGVLDSKGQRYMEVISTTAVEMGQLIDDLLAFSRIGRVEIRKTTVNLEALLREAMATCQAEASDRVIECNQGTVPLVEGDPSLLKQVCVNLLSNAVKYTRPRNPARIDTGLAEETADEVVVYVRDNGVGFDMNYASKLFGVFQRLHRSEEFEGTGIGLANVRRIISRHGGRIWAEAAVGTGATFYFTLKKAKKG